MSYRATSGHHWVFSLGFLGNANPFQKSALSHLISLSSAFQNGMTLPISTNDHRGDAFLVKGLFGGQAKATTFIVTYPFQSRESRTVLKKEPII